MPNSSKPQLSWLRLFTQTALAIYAYVFMEWLFFATKPSFMDALPLGQKLEVFLLTVLVLAVLAMSVLLVLRLLGFIPGVLKHWQVFLFIGGILPAVICAALSLLLIDNFTYTLFKFGIVTSRGILRGGMALLVVALLVLWYRQVLRNIHITTAVDPIISHPKMINWQKAQAWLVLALFVVSFGVGIVRFATNVSAAGEINAILQNRPHIILIGSDGLVANRMSLYGYERQTTPHLDQLAETSLVAENNWSNATTTTGSIFSMLNGKYPATTRLLYSPNILQGLDAYQHLPGILQRAGYRTVEIAIPWYVDAYSVNMQEGFDKVNGRAIDQSGIPTLARQYHFEDVGYFLPRLYERIADRLLHIFFIRTMSDPYRQVTQPEDPNSIPEISDVTKISSLLNQLRTANQPLFVHVHLMSTHGKMFYPRQQVFSTGEEQTRNWMTDFYDDGVLDFDSYVGELVDGLESSGLLEQTIIIVYSDHADQWRTDSQIPLLFRFPRGEYAGKIRNNTQNLDFAPTVLDYLGMDVPAWMSGQSLLVGEPTSTRPIISADVVEVECTTPDWGCVIDQKASKPPFYQFKDIQVVICQKMYTLNLGSDKLTESDVKNFPAPCQTEELPGIDQVRQVIQDHLKSNGFDISTLK
jgi:hypothetical protein